MPLDLRICLAQWTVLRWDCAKTDCPARIARRLHSRLLRARSSLSESCHVRRSLLSTIPREYLGHCGLLHALFSMIGIQIPVGQNQSIRNKFWGLGATSLVPHLNRAHQQPRIRQAIRGTRYSRLRSNPERLQGFAWPRIILPPLREVYNPGLSLTNRMYSLCST